MTPLMLENAVTMPSNMTTKITLQPKYTATSFQTQLNFQVKAIIFVDPIDQFITFCLLVVQFAAHRCIVSIKNRESP